MSICSSQLIIGSYDSEVERFDMFREAFNRRKPYRVYPSYLKVPMRIQRKIPVRKDNLANPGDDALRTNLWINTVTTIIQNSGRSGGQVNAPLAGPIIYHDRGVTEVIENGGKVVEMRGGGRLRAYGMCTIGKIIVLARASLLQHEEYEQGTDICSRSLSIVTIPSVEVASRRFPPGVQQIEFALWGTFVSYSCDNNVGRTMLTHPIHMPDCPFVKL
ncbi:hypothetical protein JOM56_012275 [Amanita muscaria]